MIFDGLDGRRDDDGLYLFFPYNLSDGERLYLVQFIPGETVANRDRPLQLQGFVLSIWLMGLGFFLVWIIATGLMLRRIANRTAKLSNWTQSLGLEDRDAEKPGFWL